MVRTAFLLILVLARVAAATASSEPPVRVTTDSVAYCSELATRLSAQPVSATETVRSLAEEGTRLCETGHVRTGIAKLRRALRAVQAGG